MSTRNELQKQVAALFADCFQIDVPSGQTDLISAGILDSLKFVDLLVQLEQKFGTTVDLNSLDLDDFRCLDSIGDFLARQLDRSKAELPG